MGASASASALAAARDATIVGALQNGATYSLWPDERDAVVSCQIWIRVGSGDEEPGRTGLAHMLEHLMFRGTDAVPDGMYDEEMEGMGASINAATWLDYTVYTSLAPPNALPRILALEADRFSGLALTEEVFAAERSVVANERRQSIDADPESMLAEQLSERSMAGSGYAWSTIGRAEDIEGFTREAVLEFFARFYAPSNVHIALAGRFDPAVTTDLLEETMGNVPARPHARPVDRLGYGPRFRDALQLRLGAARVMAAWPSPAATDAEFAAWTVLDELLAGGEGSRLPVRLDIERGIVADVFTSLGEHARPSLYTVEATLHAGVSPDEVLDEVEQLLRSVAEDGPGEAELETVRRRVAMRDALALGSAGARCDGMGTSWIVHGDPVTGFGATDAIHRVTTEDVRRVAASLVESGPPYVLVGLPQGEGSE